MEAGVAWAIRMAGASLRKTARILLVINIVFFFVVLDLPSLYSVGDFSSMAAHNFSVLLVTGERIGCCIVALAIDILVLASCIGKGMVSIGAAAGE